MVQHVELGKFKGVNVLKPGVAINGDQATSAQGVRIDNPFGALNNTIGMVKTDTVGAGYPIMAIHQLPKHGYTTTESETVFTVQNGAVAHEWGGWETGFNDFEWDTGWTNVEILHYDTDRGWVFGSGTYGGETVNFRFPTRSRYPRFERIEIPSYKSITYGAGYWWAISGGYIYKIPPDFQSYETLEIEYSDGTAIDCNNYHVIWYYGGYLFAGRGGCSGIKGLYTAVMKITLYGKIVDGCVVLYTHDEVRDLSIIVGPINIFFSFTFTGYSPEILRFSYVINTATMEKEAASSRVVNYTGVAYNDDGSGYAADPDNNRVAKIDSNGDETGGYLTGLSSNIDYIGFEGDSYLVIGDKGNDKVRIVDVF
jgi:hypothetical protein